MDVIIPSTPSREPSRQPTYTKFLTDPLNRRFVAPAYDVVANLTAFTCAVAASLLLGHWVPASLSAVAILCWLALARRTVMAIRDRREVPRG